MPEGKVMYNTNENPKTSPWLTDIPSPKDIIKEALKELSYSDRFKLLQIPANEAVRELERKCHEIYNRYEEQVRRNFREGKYGEYSDREFETSLANSRRARAGATLEQIFKLMLRLREIPWEKPSDLREAEFDFVIPDMNTLEKNPDNAVLISLKRKVRERWKLTVGDAYILRKIYGYKNNIWFVSLFEPPSEAVKVFLKLGIRVYVPDDSYERILEKIRTSVSEDESSKLRKFSQVFSDLEPFCKHHHQKKLGNFMR
ncbi:MAG: type II restriction endonuclease [Nitrososphaerota archaeon]